MDAMSRVLEGSDESAQWMLRRGACRMTSQQSCSGVTAVTIYPSPSSMRSALRPSLLVKNAAHVLNTSGALRITGEAGARRLLSIPSGPTTGGIEDPFAYCKEFVRKHDYDAFLVSQFYPREKQNGYYAMKALYNEIALVQDSVSNVMLGKMRMQFWRDAVHSLSDGRPPKHPIALALYETSKGTKIAPYHLKRIIDARDNELDGPAHMTTDSLTAHAESTSSTLLYLFLSLLDLSSETLSHAASHLGVAQSLCILLRALPYHASKGRMVIPATITAKHGVRQEEVFRKGPTAEGIEDAVFEFATLANDHLITAREMFKETGGKVPQAAMPVFVSGVPVASYLKRLEGVNFNAFHPSLQLRDWKSLQDLPDLMDRLCVEILQLIFNELDNPASFALMSKRYYEFSQDPYVRAQYFLSHYGRIQAFYWALDSGKLMNERVIDILLSSGAHLSRYLVQTAIHHFYRTSVPFIKTPWVRNIPLSTFAYFQKVASERLGGDVSPCKNEDDGTVFSHFIKESRFPPNSRFVKLETIIEMFEKYKFIPFCTKDPIMTQFPLALAIEPRLLPLAVANGFTMDSRYRDFIFRRMFEQPSGSNNGRSEDILHNVRELCRLDSSMFISRTVAAEICMEAQANAAAYSTLKTLDSKGELRFELALVIEELIKLFVKTRSITNTTTVNALRHLYLDYPSKDPTVRLVLMVTVFSGNGSDMSPETLHAKVEALKLAPLTKRDIHNVLLSPFVDRHTNVMKYAKAHVGIRAKEVRVFLEDVAKKCLEISCKLMTENARQGKMLRSINHEYCSLEKALIAYAMEHYQVSLQDFEGHDEEVFAYFEAPLNRDLNCIHSFEEAVLSSSPSNGEESDEDEDTDQLDDDYEMDVATSVAPSTIADADGLLQGHVGQETLSQAIRQDELIPARRRRLFPLFISHFTSDMTSRLHYPEHSLHVGRWVRNEFGTRHFLTAIFLTHAVINCDHTLLPIYLPLDASPSVPITLKHFQLLARLGRVPPYALFQAIHNGAEFFMSEDDYLKGDPKIKKENTPSADLAGPSSSSLSVAQSLASISAVTSSARVRNNPTTTTPHHFGAQTPAICRGDGQVRSLKKQSNKSKVETNLQKWIYHLSALLKEEQKKYNERRKRLEKELEPGTKIRLPKACSQRLFAFDGFTKVDISAERAEEALQFLIYGSDVVDEEYSEGDDDEYQYRSRRAKRQKTAVTSVV
ncbi:hypothetical protein EW146_g4100 [Bondarzewia mesenterica]|uniref:Uncharacterized protein n=1 Tax=Bondarzewia mesenterica TaxID=1095465 RepID=A0A4S4LVQ7_9AGAM|nr:hypothetical protein EW146_g4100 [Bondarzewia mesenterica]